MTQARRRGRTSGVDDPAEGGAELPGDGDGGGAAEVAGGAEADHVGGGVPAPGHAHTEEGDGDDGEGVGPGDGHLVESAVSAEATAKRVGKRAQEEENSVPHEVECGKDLMAYGSDQLGGHPMFTKYSWTRESSVSSGWKASASILRWRAATMRFS